MMPNNGMMHGMMHGHDGGPPSTIYLGQQSNDQRYEEPEPEGDNVIITDTSSEISASEESL